MDATHAPHPRENQCSGFISVRSVCLGRFCISSFYQYLLGTSYVPGTVLGAKDRAVNKTKLLFS